MSKATIHSLVKAAFLECFSLASSAAQQEYLAKLQESQPEIARSVQELLELAGTSLASVSKSNPSHSSGDTPGNAGATGQTEMAGAVIERYTLLEQIGEGGMGTVFMAQQSIPIKRRVALKIVKPGMDSREVIARFEAERQALTLMEHPNIAKVFDAGTTDQGRPYFVMELVKGIPLTEFCQVEKLGVEQRLRLFAEVCQGIQHAHQKGVIHRDIKPSNVMATLRDGKPVVKIIDFGIAKAINQNLTDLTLFTGVSQMMGTPLYMSPEQADISGLDVDTRSDVYSLGVMLYELLTDTTPFDGDELRKAGIDEIRRIIRETDPPRPSLRLTTTAGTTSTLGKRAGQNLRQIQLKLASELDWIVMKAIEKERDRRYESPLAFAADIDCFLNDQPVEACPPSWGYRVGKGYRKHRVLTLASCGLVLLLAAGISATTWQWLRAEGNAALVSRLAESERQQREIADARALDAIASKELADRRLYVSQIRRAQSEWEHGDPAVARQTLYATRAGLRGWEYNFLNRLFNQDRLMSVQAHQGSVTSLAWNAEGTRILTCGGDRKFKTWDVKTGQALVVGGPLPMTPSAGIYSRDSKKLITAGAEHIIQVWDSSNGQLVSEIQPPGNTKLLALSPDGKRLASSHPNQGTWVWDLDTGESMHEFKLDHRVQCCLQFSADGQSIYTADRDNNFYEWTPDMGGLLGGLRELTGLDYSPVLLDRHNTETQRVVAATDERHVASGSMDGSLKILGFELGETVHHLEAHEGYCRTLSFSADNTRLASGGDDKLVRVWDVESAQPLNTYRGHLDHVHQVAFSPNGKFLASGSWDGELIVWKEADSELVLAGHTKFLTAIAVSPDGRRLATAAHDGSVRVWDTTHMQIMHVLDGNEHPFLTYLQFSPDSTRLASGGIRDKQLIQWNVETGVKIRSFEVPDNSYFQYAPSGTQLIRLGNSDHFPDCEIVIQNVDSGSIEQRIKVQGVLHAVSPDGSLSAVRVHSEDLTILATHTGKTLAKLSDAPKGIRSSAVFSFDNEYIAFSANASREIKIWALPSGELVHTLVGHSDKVKKISFSSDASRLVSGGTAGELNVWDVSTGELLLNLHAHKGSVSPIFSPDGRTIFSAGSDRVVRVWQSQ